MIKQPIVYLLYHGILDSQGVPVWHKPQPYLGANSFLVFKSHLSQVGWSLPFPIEMALTRHLSVQTPQLMQYS